MKIKWQVDTPARKLRTFLRQQGVSRRLLAHVRNAGGALLVNGDNGRMIDRVMPGDQVTLVLPPEENRKTPVIPSYVPVDVLYEDDDFLVVNKPPFVAAIPSPLHRDDSLVSRVTGYYRIRHYDDIIPHLVTRLDRDTSGAVLFAKHRYAHALIDQELQAGRIHKEYCAGVEGSIWWHHRMITAPIGRQPGSTMKRMVRSDGKRAVTEAWVEHRLAGVTQLRVRLWTGRTHQIRVHCAALGHPLIGDDMYGGKMLNGMERQALHCRQLRFWQVRTQRWVTVTAPLPEDMRQLLKMK